jgi:hypothetical protein
LPSSGHSTRHDAPIIAHDFYLVTLKLKQIQTLNRQHSNFSKTQF